MKSAGERNMLQHLKSSAAYLLETLLSCPTDLVRPSNEFLPCIWFENGFRDEDKGRYRPNATYFEYQGLLYRLQRGQKRWTSQPVK